MMLLAVSVVPTNWSCSRKVATQLSLLPQSVGGHSSAGSPVRSVVRWYVTMAASWTSAEEVGVHRTSQDGGRRSSKGVQAQQLAERGHASIGGAAAQRIHLGELPARPSRCRCPGPRSPPGPAPGWAVPSPRCGAPPDARCRGAGGADPVGRRRASGRTWWGWFPGTWRALAPQCAEAARAATRAAWTAAWARKSCEKRATKRAAPWRISETQGVRLGEPRPGVVEDDAASPQDDDDRGVDGRELTDKVGRNRDDPTLQPALRNDREPGQAGQHRTRHLVCARVAEVVDDGRDRGRDEDDGGDQLVRRKLLEEATHHGECLLALSTRDWWPTPGGCRLATRRHVPRRVAGLGLSACI